MCNQKFVDAYEKNNVILIFHYQNVFDKMKVIFEHHINFINANDIVQEELWMIRVLHSTSDYNSVISSHLKSHFIHNAAYVRNVSLDTWKGSRFHSFGKEGWGTLALWLLQNSL